MGRIWDFLKIGFQNILVRRPPVYAQIWHPWALALFCSFSDIGISESNPKTKSDPPAVQGSVVGDLMNAQWSFRHKSRGAFGTWHHGRRSVTKPSLTPPDQYGFLFIALRLKLPEYDKKRMKFPCQYVGSVHQMTRMSVDLMKSRAVCGYLLLFDGKVIKAIYTGVISS